MVTNNMGDADYKAEGDSILAFNNVEMTSADALAFIEWAAEQVQMAEEAQTNERPGIQVLQALINLIELEYNLGQGHFQDTNEDVNIVLGGEYILPEEAIDPEKSADEDAEEDEPADDETAVEVAKPDNMDAAS
jgi:hypothetical protein